MRPLPKHAPQETLRGDTPIDEAKHRDKPSWRRDRCLSTVDGGIAVGPHRSHMRGQNAWGAEVVNVHIDKRAARGRPERALYHDGVRVPHSFPLPDGYTTISPFISGAGMPHRDRYLIALRRRMQPMMHTTTRMRAATIRPRAPASSSGGVEVVPEVVPEVVTEMAAEATLSLPTSPRACL